MEDLRAELEAIQAAAAHARTLTGRELDRAVNAIGERARAALGNDPVRNALERIGTEFSMPRGDRQYFLKLVGLIAQDGLKAADAQHAAEEAATPARR